MSERIDTPLTNGLHLQERLDNRTKVIEANDLAKFRNDSAKIHFAKSYRHNLAKCSGGVKSTSADSYFRRLRRIFDTAKRCPNHTIPRNPPGNPLPQALSAPTG